jgi:hypothetical protein
MNNNYLALQRDILALKYKNLFSLIVEYEVNMRDIWKFDFNEHLICLDLRKYFSGLVLRIKNHSFTLHFKVLLIWKRIT